MGWVSTRLREPHWAQRSSKRAERSLIHAGSRDARLDGCPASACWRPASVQGIEDSQWNPSGGKKHGLKRSQGETTERLPGLRPVGARQRSSRAKGARQARPSASLAGSRPAQRARRQSRAADPVDHEGSGGEEKRGRPWRGRKQEASRPRGGARPCESQESIQTRSAPRVSEARSNEASEDSAPPGQGAAASLALHFPAP